MAWWVPGCILGLWSGGDMCLVVLAECVERLHCHCKSGAVELWAQLVAT